MFADFIKRQLEKKNPKHKDTPFLVCKDKHPYEPPGVFRKPAKYSPFPAPDFFVPTKFQAMCPNCRTICESFEIIYLEERHLAEEVKIGRDIEARFVCPYCHIQWNDNYRVIMTSRNITTPEVSYAPSPEPLPAYRPPDSKVISLEDEDVCRNIDEENRKYETYLRELGKTMLKSGVSFDAVREQIEKKKKERIIPFDK